MTKWEFLIWRAKLAGIKVEDNGGNVLFEQQCDGFVNALVWTYEQIDMGADWLKQADVTLPGWELPWPDPPKTWEQAKENAAAFNAASLSSLDRFLEE